MSTNQKIILLIILVGAVAAIGIFSIESNSSTSTSGSEKNSDGADTSDSTLVDSGATGDKLFSNSDEFSSGGGSGGTSGNESDENETDIFGGEVASAENRVEDEESSSSSEQNARIPQDRQSSQSGSEKDQSPEEEQNTSAQSEQSGTGNILGNNANDGGDSGSSSDNTLGSGSGERTYEVKAGDKLWSIAEKFYGSGKEWKRIKQANRSQIPDNNQLKRGWTLTIPKLEQENALANQESSSSLNTTSSESSGNPTSGNSASTYQVKSGDRLWNIIKQRYGRVTDERVQKVAEINNINPANLKRGMTLTLPEGLFGGGSEGNSGRTESTGGSDSAEGSPPFEAGAGQEWYRVKGGESLWKISKKKYGTGKYLWKIWNLNKDRFEDYNDIPKGSWLLIPKNP